MQASRTAIPLLLFAVVAAPSCSSIVPEGLQGRDIEPMQVEGDIPADGPHRILNEAEIERSLQALVDCVEPTLEGYIRFRVDPYLVGQFEFGIPGATKEEGRRAAQIFERCESQSGFTTIWETVLTQPASAPEVAAIADEIEACAVASGDDHYATLLSEQQPTTADVLMQLVHQAPSQNECIDEAVYGPRIDF